LRVFRSNVAVTRSISKSYSVSYFTSRGVRVVRNRGVCGKTYLFGDASPRAAMPRAPAMLSNPATRTRPTTVTTVRPRPE
jgi:hypothetical protein